MSTFVLLLVVLAVFLPDTRTAYGAEAKADNATLRVVLDNKRLALDTDAELVNRQPFLPLRDVCEALGGGVRWDAEDGRAAIIYRQQIFPVDGLIVQNRMMVSPEEISQMFSLNYAYDPVLSTVVFDHGNLPTQEQLLSLLPQHEDYSSEDLYWLSRIVEAEATGESYESRLAVANVILNRLNNPAYPDSIQGVIFDKKYGVQFTPVSNGSVYNEPSTLSFLAALDALEGKNNAPGALFFMNPKYATSFWMQKNRQFAFTIGGHSYYY